MTTVEGIATAILVVLSFVGIAVAALVRRSERGIPPDLDPRHDDPTRHG